MELERVHLTCSREGIADEELAKKETERGRKRKLEEDDGATDHGKSSRSSSQSSISTISTNKSRSLSPVQRHGTHTGQSQMMADLEVTGKHRHRSLSTSMSYSSSSEYSRHGHRHSPHRRHSDRRRPSAGRTESKVSNLDHRKAQQQRRSSRYSSTSDSAQQGRRRRRLPSIDRGKRRRRASKSPNARGRERGSYEKMNSRRTHSPSQSRDRSLVTRHRKSMTPRIPSDGVGGLQEQHRWSQSSRENRSSHGEYRDRQTNNVASRTKIARPESPQRNRTELRKERSLSPFSKRVALTQAMSRGS